MAVADRRAALLQIGLDLFADQTPDEVRVEDVARAAGVSTGLLYNYFGSKREFHVAVVAAAYEQLRAATEPDPLLPSDERLRASLTGFLEHVRDNATGWAWLLRGAPGSDAELVSLGDAMRQTVIDRVLTDLPAQDVTPAARVAVRGWIGYIEACAVAWLSRPELRQDQVLELMVATLHAALHAALTAVPEET
jgi:AcrR family transcriptional regulator